MLTKQIAIERLRATGTLATEQRAALIADPQHVSTPVARDVSNLQRSARTSSRRHLAPTACQAVLP